MAQEESPYPKGFEYYFLSLEQISRDFNSYKTHWEESATLQNLSQTFEQILQDTHHLVISRCICIALGTFARPLKHPVSKSNYPNDALWQLVALIKILEILRRRHPVEEVYIQDPKFNEIETSFLRDLGFTVLEDPEAKGKMTSSTFLFAPHCEHGVLAMHLVAAFPALYMGNDLELILRDHRDSVAEGSDEDFEEQAIDGPIEDTLSRFCEATAARVIFEPECEPWLTSMTARWLKG